MANLNRVLLMGRLTRDPEMRYTPSGSAVVEFGLAVNRTYKDQSGERKEQTCFVDVQAWARQAEVMNEYLSKGRQVFIEGRLDFSSWETPNGEKRSKLRVVCENFQFIGGRDDAGGGGGGYVDQSEPRSEPRSQSRQDGGGFGGQSEGDLNLGDVPF